MLFFQACLLSGYLYAHVIVRYLNLRYQVGIHIGLLCISLTQLPISPDKSVRPDIAADPTWNILVLLIMEIGLPFFALSATVPLIQSWVSRAKILVAPYRLYALSNAASLLALLTYPTLFEPFLSRTSQGVLWSFLFGTFVIVFSFCAYVVRHRWGDALSSPDHKELDGQAPRLRTQMLWLAFAATAVVLMLAVTNELTRDLVSIPFLWVLPLAVYLLSFIVCFDNDRWYFRKAYLIAIVPTIIAVGLMMLMERAIPVPILIGVFLVTLFALCMVCHGELSRLKPHSNYLTNYYLTIGAGGVLGGVFVAIVMPLLSNTYLELHIGLVAVPSLVLLALWNDHGTFANLRLVRTLCIAGVALTSFGLATLHLTQDLRQDVVYQSRNFYGVLTVIRENAGGSRELLILRNGNSPHGAQFSAPGLRTFPAAYYAPHSGIGLALRLFGSDKGRRFGVIGLGAGTIAAYAGPGDYLRFYEINPDVKVIADTYFSYLRDSYADISIAIGDARLSLGHEQPNDFDVLVVDAFSSDAIPVHLLTLQAFELYIRHIKSDGAIAFLISSIHFDFEPLIRGLSEKFGMKAILIENNWEGSAFWGARWMLVTRNKAFLSQERVRTAETRVRPGPRKIRLWTDDFSSPFQLLKRRLTKARYPVSTTLIASVLN